MTRVTGVALVWSFLDPAAWADLSCLVLLDCISRIHWGLQKQRNMPALPARQKRELTQQNSC